GKITLEAAVGRSRRTGGITYIALPHPSGASRWLNDPGHRLLLARALAKVHRAVRTLDNGASERRIRDERPTHGRRLLLNAEEEGRKEEEALDPSMRGAPRA